MGLLFIDGFDHLALTDLTKKWSTMDVRGGGTGVLAVGTAYGRLGSGGLQSLFNALSDPCYAYVTRTYPNRATVILGFAYSITSFGWAADKPFAAIIDNATVQLDIRCDASRRPYVTRNGTLLASGAVGLNLGQWYYIELKATIHGSTGSMELRVNGTTQATFSGNTSATGNAFANRVRVGVESTSSVTGYTESHYDDVYLLEADSGAGLIDFLGDVRVQTLLPNGPGINSGMTAIAPIERSRNATVVASSNYPATVPSSITDANSATYWRPNTSPGAAWFYIDLGSAMQIDQFMHWQDRNIVNEWVIQYRIEYSNDLVGWTQAYLSPASLTCAASERAMIPLTFPGNARYWRWTPLAFTSGAAGTWTVYETALYSVAVPSSNWLAVNDVPPDTVGYVRGTTAGTYDTYAYADLTPSSNRVFAVAQSFLWQKEDAGVRTATLRVRSGGVEADVPGAVNPLTGSYGVQQQIAEVNPVTGGQWTVAEVNDAEFGPKVAT